jgi:hypothetical protein
MPLLYSLFIGCWLSLGLMPFLFVLVLVQKNRQLIKEREREEQEWEEAEKKKELKDRERKQETRHMVAEVIRREKEQSEMSVPPSPPCHLDLLFCSQIQVFMMRFCAVGVGQVCGRCGLGEWRAG